MTNFLMMATFFMTTKYWWWTSFDDDQVNSLTRDMICYAAADVLALVKYYHEHNNSDVGSQCNGADGDSNWMCFTRLSLT